MGYIIEHLEGLLILLNRLFVIFLVPLWCPSGLHCRTVFFLFVHALLKYIIHGYGHCIHQTLSHYLFLHPKIRAY